MLWDPFLYCINDSIQGNSETGNKVFVLPSKVAINMISLNLKFGIGERFTVKIDDFFP
jgi:hypothetical protein